LPIPPEVSSVGARPSGSFGFDGVAGSFALGLDGFAADAFVGSLGVVGPVGVELFGALPRQPATNTTAIIIGEPKARRLRRACGEEDARSIVLRNMVAS
jgi:hypothetical protein